MKFDVDGVRGQFPALQRIVNGQEAIYLDGPGGTQVPRRVVDKVVDYLFNRNGNSHGVFVTSVESDAVVQRSRESFADFFGCTWEEVSFCHNSTTISFKLSQAIARGLKPGDEVIVTDIDHEANRSPWVMMKESGIVIKSVRVDRKTCTLDMQDYAGKLSPRTRVVAANCASNAVGTISDIRRIADLAHEVGAVTIVDAVHYAPHRLIDVRNMDTDFLYCSAHKFFGPHVGVLYSKKGALDALQTLRVSEQSSDSPYRFETGTLIMENIAGAAEALEFIAAIGAAHQGYFTGKLERLEGRRRSIAAGMLAIEGYERPNMRQLKEGLSGIPGTTLFGPPEEIPHTATASFTMEGFHPARVAEFLADRGIFVWAGNFYAARLAESLGVNDSGGWVRIGLSPYNTRDEIDRTIAALKDLRRS